MWNYSQSFKNTSEKNSLLVNSQTLAGKFATK